MQGDIINHHYKLLERITEDSLSITYQALDQEENRHVAVQVLKEDVARQSVETLLRLKREIKRLSKINHPNLLNILGSGEYEGRFYLITEQLAGGQPLAVMSGKVMDPDTSVAFMLKICSGLAAAHEQDLVHHSLNQSTVLISETGEETTIKLTGFGMSLLLDLAAIKEEQEVVKTFGYMSPEEAGILRKPVDQRSDLYSAGIIFYQLVTGRLPYDGKDVSTLLHQHVAQQSIPPTEINSATPPVLERIILRLIAKDPVNRYQSIDGLLADLSEYRRQRAEGKEVVEFEIARADHLKELRFATRLIGRDDELDALKNAINRASDSKGSLFLIHGGSGSGKTRLIEELGAYMHTVGGALIGGAGIQSDLKIPFQIFSESLGAYIRMLNRLSSEERSVRVNRMKDTLGDLGGGKIVKIAPEITDFIGEVLELVSMDSEKEGIRFLMTVTNFMLSLGTQESPLVIALDDMQWADHGSIELFERIAKETDAHPVVVIAVFTDTEVESDHVLMEILGRIKEGGTAVNDIHIQSFKINHMAQIISEETRKILSYASVMGRDIQFELLTHLTAFSQEKILDALEEGIGSQFLARDSSGKGKIYFVHERILKTFYWRVPNDRRQALHEGVGRSLLEKEYKDNPEPVLHDLAHHFFQVGVEDKTLLYSIQAAEKAQHAYACDQAIQFFMHAREILEHQGKTSSDEYIDLLENMGSVFKTAGQFDEALEALKACEERIPKEDTLRRAEVLSKAGDTLWEKGEGDQATKLLAQALKSLGVRLPGNIFGAWTGLTKESFVQGLHTLLPGLFVRKEYKHGPKKAVIVRIVIRIACFYFFTDVIRCLHLVMKFLNLGERMGLSRVLSNIYATHTVIVSGFPVAARAKRDGDLAVKIAQDFK